MSGSAQINEVDSIALARKVISCRFQDAKLPALERVRAIALGLRKIAAMETIGLVALIFRSRAHTHCSEAQVAHVATAMKTSQLVVNDKITHSRRQRQWRLQVPWVQFLTGISIHTS